MFWGLEPNTTKCWSRESSLAAKIRYLVPILQRAGAPKRTYSISQTHDARKQLYVEGEHASDFLVSKYKHKNENEHKNESISL